MKSVTKTLGALLLSSVLLLSACGGDAIITSLRVGVAFSRPIVQSLVDTHVIPESKATAVLGDVTDGLAYSSQAEAAIKQLSPSLTKEEKRIAKARIYFALAQNLRTVLNRHNIGGQETLDKIATIFSGVITALEEYYRQVVPQPGVAARAASGVDPDKQLEQALKNAERQMKALQQHQ